MKYLLLFPVVFPVLCGFFLFGAKFKNHKTREWLIIIELCINTAMVWVLAFLKPDLVTVAKFADNLQLSFFLDRPAMLFSCMVSVLWIPATIYAFEYMEHEREHLGRDERWINVFFAYYVMTYGITVGLAYAANPLTMYIFFEALSLVTMPLVIHLQDNKSIIAGRRYLRFMLGGAAFGFISLVFMIMYQSGDVFRYGGILDFSGAAAGKNLFLFVFICGFCGFGVKTALFPFGQWLISASVAPTPVTALLHAVAVVKGGAFVLIRLVYYCFGTEYLRGTWAHYTVLGLVCATIIYGSTMAVRETHLKRRLAYSTMSNLSYVLLGVVTMSKVGLVAAFLHMLFHAFMKIDGFFCTGVVMQRERRTYVDECNGLGKKIPLVMVCFTVAGLSLTGIPPLSGFLSKWFIADGLIQEKNVAFYIAVGVLLYSALCTAVYMLTTATRAWFAPKGSEMLDLSESKTGWKTYAPLVFFTLMVVLFGLLSNPLIGWLSEIPGM